MTVVKPRSFSTAVIFGHLQFMRGIPTKTVAAIMGFLTLRPGDTDRDYFDSYTAEQIEFRDTHAETLACEVYSRFEAKEGK